MLFLISHVTVVSIIILAYILLFHNFNTKINVLKQQQENNEIFVNTHFDTYREREIKKNKNEILSTRNKKFLSDVEVFIQQIFAIIRYPSVVSITYKMKQFYKQLLVNVQEKGIINFTMSEFEKEFDIVNVLILESIKEKESTDFLREYLEFNALAKVAFIDAVNSIIVNKTNYKNENFLLHYLAYIVRTINDIAHLYIIKIEKEEKTKIILIETLIRENKIQTAINKLLASNIFKEEHNELLLLSARYANIQEQKKLKINENSVYEENRIIDSLIQILKKYNEKENYNKK